MKKIILLLARLVLLFIIIFLSIIAYFYISCPVYDFPEPKAFSGEKLFNPYEGIDSIQWKKGNFQIQSRAWMGITGGSGNTNEIIDSIYTLLGYDIIATSDYMKINKYRINKPDYISVYEHGYGLQKYHQVLLGSEKVSWRDYPFFPSLSHKQHVIRFLRKHNQLIFMAHPKLRHGILPEDLLYLTGYDGVEVLNYMRFSYEQWDAALSSGKYVTIMGNDDAHDIEQTLEVGHCYTSIYSSSVASDSIIEAIRKGRHYGADIYRKPDETYAYKAEKAKLAAKLSGVKVINDTLFVSVSKQAAEFRFVGQNGTILHRQHDTDTAFYVIQPDDPYVRTEITFNNKDVYYLNPIARYSDEIPGNPFLATIDWTRTIIYRGLTAIIVLLLLFLILRKVYFRKTAR